MKLAEFLNRLQFRKLLLLLFFIVNCQLKREIENNNKNIKNINKRVTRGRLAWQVGRTRETDDKSCITT